MHAPAGQSQGSMRARGGTLPFVAYRGSSLESSFSFTEAAIGKSMIGNQVWIRDLHSCSLSHFVILGLVSPPLLLSAPQFPLLGDKIVVAG